jgi:nitrile hydratase beta subunit-like protein
MLTVKFRFAEGDRVKVLDIGKSGHIRTPFYIRGCTGTILHRCGAFLNPEDLSIGIVAGPVIPLYRVSFPMTEIWPDYNGNSRDALYVEIYDHWLAAADLSTMPNQGTAI